MLIPMIPYNMEWGQYKVLEALIRLDMESEDTRPPQSRSSCPWGVMLRDHVSGETTQ